MELPVCKLLDGKGLWEFFARVLEVPAQHLALGSWHLAIRLSQCGEYPLPEIRRTRFVRLLEDPRGTINAGCRLNAKC
jgi:hypothetical protein